MKSKLTLTLLRAAARLLLASPLTALTQGPPPPPLHTPLKVGQGQALSLQKMPHPKHHDLHLEGNKLAKRLMYEGLLVLPDDARRSRGEKKRVPQSNCLFKNHLRKDLPTLVGIIPFAYPS